MDGERIVTSAEAGAFPAGLPVGIVRLSSQGVPEVELFAGSIGWMRSGCSTMA